jgi:hypothetical protein
MRLLCRVIFLLHCLVTSHCFFIRPKIYSVVFCFAVWKSLCILSSPCCRFVWKSRNQECYRCSVWIAPQYYADLSLRLVSQSPATTYIGGVEFGSTWTNWTATDAKQVDYFIAIGGKPSAAAAAAAAVVTDSDGQVQPAGAAAGPSVGQQIMHAYVDAVGHSPVRNALTPSLAHSLTHSLTHTRTAVVLFTFRSEMRATLPRQAQTSTVKI